jgi:hypothetical protein
VEAPNGSRRQPNSPPILLRARSEAVPGQTAANRSRPRLPYKQEVACSSQAPPIDQGAHRRAESGGWVGLSRWPREAVWKRCGSSSDSSCTRACTPRGREGVPRPSCSTAMRGVPLPLPVHARAHGSVIRRSEGHIAGARVVPESGAPTMRPRCVGSGHGARSPHPAPSSSERTSIITVKRADRPPDCPGDTRPCDANGLIRDREPTHLRTELWTDVRPVSGSRLSRPPPAPASRRNSGRSPSGPVDRRWSGPNPALSPAAAATRARSL